MPLFPEAPIRLRLRGSVGQRELDGLASLAVHAEGLIIVPLDSGLQAGVPIRIAFAFIDGVEVPSPMEDARVILLRSGERIAAQGDVRIAGLAQAIVDRGRVVPELTRALRTLGGRRGGAGQDAFFKPLLDARRAAAAGGIAALDAFDAVQLRYAVEAQLARLAAAHAPSRAAAQRALEACLRDAAEPLLDALPQLAAAAQRARDAGAASALHAWREWADTLRRVFERADAAWIAVRATIDAMPAERPAGGPGRAAWPSPGGVR